MSTPGQDKPAIDATLGPISAVSAAAVPGTARTSAGASEATDRRCGLLWRPAGRVLDVRLGSAAGPPACPPRWGSGSLRWGSDSARGGSGSPRWGSGSLRWGSDSARWGSGSLRLGSDSARCGSGSARCGSGSSRCGSDSRPGGSGWSPCTSAVPRWGSASRRPGRVSLLLISASRRRHNTSPCGAAASPRRGSGSNGDREGSASSSRWDDVDSERSKGDPPRGGSDSPGGSYFGWSPARCGWDAPSSDCGSPGCGAAGWLRSVTLSYRNGPPSTWRTFCDLHAKPAGVAYWYYSAGSMLLSTAMSALFWSSESRC